MSFELISGPSASGKTLRAIHEIAEHIVSDPLYCINRVRLITPTRQAADQIRNNVMNSTGISSIMGNVICSFYDFTNEILQRSAFHGRPISDLQRSLALTAVAQRCDLDIMSAASVKPGFVMSLEQIVSELKIACVSPRDLERALICSQGELQTDSAQKIEELVRLYSDYQTNILENHNIYDREGLMWIALSKLSEDSRLLEYDRIIIDGFDELNGIQSQFLRMAADRVKNLTVNLNFQDGRPEVFSKTARMRDFLLKFGAQETVLPPTGISTLERSMLRNDEANHPKLGALTILEAATSSLEIEMIGDEILRLVSDKMACYNDIAIICPDIAQFHSRIARAFSLRNIPLAAPNARVRDSAIGAMMLGLLNVVSSDWSRESVLAHIKMASLEQGCLIEIQAHSLGIHSGREKWLEPWPKDGDTRQARLQALANVAKFEDDMRAVQNLADIQAATSGLMEALTADRSDTDLLAKDISALRQIEAVLREILDIWQLINRPVEAKEFIIELALAVSEAEYIAAAATGEQVKLIAAHALGGYRPEVAFMIGVLEKAYPREIPAEPFLSETERRVLNRHLDGRLRLPSIAREDEQHKFYQCATCANKHLYITYPLTDEKSAETLRSFYVDEIYALSDEPIETIRRDSSQLVCEIDLAQDERQQLQALVYALAQHEDNPRADGFKGLYNAFIANHDHSIRRIFGVRSDLPVKYDDTDILEQMEHIHNTFKCLEIEDFAVCPFMRLCKHELGIRPLREEMDKLDEGTLLHNVIDKLFVTLQAENNGRLNLGELNLESVLAIAERFYVAEFENCLRMINMPALERDTARKRLWRMLADYLRDELDLGSHELEPTHFEMAFGADGSPPLSIEDVDIVGRIDRIDLDAAGKGCLVIDYKQGYTPSIQKFDTGMTIQVMIYALAARQILGLDVIGAEYRSIKHWKREGLYQQNISNVANGRVKTPEEFEKMLNKTCDVALQIARDIRAGIADVNPAECPSYCAFKAICRIDDNKRLRIADTEEASS